ncbi:MAG: hypothetical protein KIT31_07180 [Deltaproteobacteria bacterium]|nr:hypothetical protein [Deltaproteobacteria bacterium]
MELPLFVVHGAIVWKVLLVALVSVSLVFVERWRRRTERHRVVAEVEARLGQVTPVEAGAVVLRGRIEKGAATTTVTVAKREISVSERSAELLLDVGGEQVTIAGAVEVRHGSHEAPSFFRRSHRRTVNAGDEVCVAGTAARVDGANASYREANVKWTLVDAQIAAVRPAARPAPPRRVAAVTTVVLLTAVWYGALNIVGSNALKVAIKGELTDSVGNLDAIAIAAAMPGSRDTALEVLERRVKTQLERSEAWLQTRLTLLDLRGDCGDARLLFDLLRLEEALAAARACGDSALATRALAFLGRFEEAWNASRRDEDPYTIATLAFATARWNEAAGALDALAVQADQRERSPGYTGADAAFAVTRLRCFAALVRTFGGAPNAIASVPGAANSAPCEMYAALARPPHEQAAALAAIVPVGVSQTTLDQLRALAGDASTLADIVGISDTLVFEMLPHPFMWLAARQLEANLVMHKSARLRLIDKHAALLVHRGDLANARQQLAEARTLDPNFLPLDSEEVALALVDPTAPMPTQVRWMHPWIADAYAIRVGRPWRSEGLSDCPERTKVAIERAQAGNGTDLAAALRECHQLDWHTIRPVLLGVGPRIKHGRDEVARVVRLIFDESSSLVNASRSLANERNTFRYLPNVAGHRNVARLLGDEEEAVRLQTILDRYAAMFADPQRLLAFLLLHE